MALPTQNEPLRLRDGRLVLPGGEIMSGQQHAVADDTPHVAPVRVRRKVSDLPVPPSQMNSIAAVLAYALYGLDDEEIAVATKLNATVVRRVRMSEPYVQMHEAIVRAAVDAETDNVRDILTKHARRAALTVVDSLDAGSRSDRMAAARDILDRSGLRPSDVVEHRHRMDGGLVIEIVKRDTNQDVPVIDMEVG